MRRIERLINLIAALLETSRPLTADQIRDEIAGYGEQPNFEAFRRAFERDKEALRAMGIPLEVVETDALGGEPEGYIIPKSKYYLPELDLEPDELAALRLAAEAIAGGSEQAEAGVMKLSVDDGGAPWGGARVTWSADVAAEQPLLGPLYSALIDRAPVAFSYRAATGEEKKRELEPYGLVHRKGNWYLVGRDRDRDAIRAFKVSRISGRIEKLEGGYEIPPGFDAKEHLSGEAWEIGPGEKETAVIRFDEPLRWWVEQNMTQLQRREAHDGGLEVDVPFTNTDALISWTLGFGEEIEIVAPAEARAALRDHLAQRQGTVS
ncbi:MAG: proteasome accessory factor [Actinomycetota bacterium]|jgi:proteasome accessory factor B|nr:proteasome accessory factor [Actinomycetota bacterium]